MEILKDSIEDKVKELLASRYAGHPITYNHYFAENVQKAQIARRKQEIEKHSMNSIPAVQILLYCAAIISTAM